MKTNINITKSKYIRFIFILIGFFVLFFLLGVFLGILNDSLIIMLSAIITLDVFIFLLPLFYYLIQIIKLEKKIKLSDKRINKIENWQQGFFRGFGKVSLTLDGVEYFSNSIYTCNEARNLVGKSVIYCIIDDKLILLDLDKTFKQ